MRAFPRFSRHRGGGQQPANFHHRQAGIKIVGWHLPAKPHQCAMCSDDLGLPLAGGRAKFSSEHRAGQFYCSLHPFAVGAGADFFGQSPAQGKAFIALAQQPLH